MRQTCVCKRDGTQCQVFSGQKFVFSYRDLVRPLCSVLEAQSNDKTYRNKFSELLSKNVRQRYLNIKELRKPLDFFCLTCLVFFREVQLSIIKYVRSLGWEIFMFKRFILFKLWAMVVMCCYLWWYFMVILPYIRLLKK